MKFKYATAIAAALVCVALSHAQDVPRLGASFVAGGAILAPYTAKPVDRGDSPVRVLRSSPPEVRNRSESIVADARKMADSRAVVGLLLLERDGSILLEEYRQGATEQSKLLSMSVSKSVTAITVGQALCDGLFPSLETPAEQISPALASTSYGRAKVRDLLMMASGGTREVTGGEPSIGWSSGIWMHSTSLRESLIHFNDPALASRQGSFEYKNLDTSALGVLVADAAKQPFTDYFAKAVWARVGPEDVGYWMVDRNGDAVVHSGFNATLRDWGRLALYVRDQVLSSGEPTCLQRYLRAATKRQISNNARKTGRAFAGYGYQFWTDNELVLTPSAWMSGYGGQRIGIDLRSGRVLVVFSNVEDYMVDVYRLFDQWSRR